MEVNIRTCCEKHTPTELVIEKALLLCGIDLLNMYRVKLPQPFPFLVIQKNVGHFKLMDNSEKAERSMELILFPIFVYGDSLS